MTLLKLAIKNLLGAGLRTWLNVFVLSLSFVLIIFSQGLLEGMNQQAEEAMIAVEVGGGQFRHPVYDRYDPLTLTDAHGPVPAPLAALAASGRAAPVLVVQGTIYPEGRLFTIQIKGIDPGQTVLDIPTSFLARTPRATRSPSSSASAWPSSRGSRRATRSPCAGATPGAPSTPATPWSSRS